jgi:glycosyltransferase involved in cell wall biosynthesis
VTTTHGEGFGRPPLEAMAMRLPTIATNWSGLTAFMSNDVALPIPVRTMDDYVDDEVGGA